jgi:hypothetical protein
MPRTLGTVQTVTIVLFDGVQSLDVTGACGYGTPEAMRRAFVRALGVSPAEYRRRFQPAVRPEESHADRHPAV